MKDQEEPVRLGKFAFTLQFLSRLYCIPIIVDFKKRILKFSFFNSHYFIYTILNLLPFCCLIIWFACQPLYFEQLIKAFLKVFVFPDVIKMLVFPGMMFSPLIGLFGSLNYYTCLPVKEELFNSRFRIPKLNYIIQLLLFEIVKLLSLALILSGIFLALTGTSELNIFSFWINFSK